MFSKQVNRNALIGSFGTPTVRRAGFSLVELMVVMVIIGLLAGVVTLSVRSYLISSKQNVARLDLSKLSEALDSFYVAHDRYPTTQEGLAALAQKTSKFPDGIIQRVQRVPWGNDYDYISPARNAPFEIVTYGADKREGGDGADMDIISTELGGER